MVEIDTAGALLRAESRVSGGAICRGAAPAASARLEVVEKAAGVGMDWTAALCVRVSVCVYMCMRVVHWVRVPVFTGSGETSAPRSAGAAS